MVVAHTSRRALLGLLLGLPVGCLGPTAGRTFDALPDRDATRKRLIELGVEYERLMHQHGQLMFQSFSGAPSQAVDPKLSALREDEAKLFTEAERLLEYHEALVSPREAKLWQLGALGIKLLGDPETQRLADALRASHAEPPVVDGQPVTRAKLAELMRSPRRAERDAAFEAIQAMQRRAGPIARELLMRRNERARQLGETYYAALLRLRHVDGPRAEGLIRRLVSGTDAAMAQLAGSLERSAARSAGRRGQRAPQDLAFALDRVLRIPDEWFPGDKAVERALAVHRAFGFDLSRIQLVMQEFSFAGQALAISVPDDVRVLVRPAPGVGLYSVLLHELGHAVAASQPTQLAALYKSYEWVAGLSEPAFDEGFAEIFGTLTGYSGVLVEHMGLDRRRAEHVAGAQRMRLMHATRRRIAWVSFEQRALGNPKQDLDRLARDIDSRLLGALHGPSAWATNPLLADYPVYGQSYVLASLLAFQVHAALAARAGASQALREGQPQVNHAAGAALAQELLAGGMRRSADEKLLVTTGRRLAVEPLLQHLRRPRAAPVDPVIEL